MEVAKRRRLSELAGTKFVTQSALAALLAKLGVGATGIASSSRRSINRSLNEDVALPTAHGSLLCEVNLCMDDGSLFSWTAVNPAALLNWFCTLCPRFESAFAALYERCRCSSAAPWSIIIYTDEAAPGSMLNQDQSRKAWLWYWQFEEFGPSVLSHEGVWFLGGLLRTDVVKDIKGGASAMFKAWVRRFFIDGDHFADGFTVHCANKAFVVVAKLNTVIADEAALKAMWDCKGASGMKPCMLCMNVVGSRQQHLADGDRYVSIQSCDIDAFHLQTDDTIWEIADKLTRLKVLSMKARADPERITKTEFQKQKRATAAEVYANLGRTA